MKYECWCLHLCLALLPAEGNRTEDSFLQVTPECNTTRHARLTQHFHQIFHPVWWPCLPFRPRLRLLRCLRGLGSPRGRSSTPSWHDRHHLRELLAFSLRRPQTRCATPTTTRCGRFHTPETAPFSLKPPNYAGWAAAPFTVKTKRSC